MVSKRPKILEMMINDGFKACFGILSSVVSKKCILDGSDGIP